jgi:hypothetical protein
MKERPLEERIHDLERECVRFIHEYAVKEAKASPGVPAVVLESMAATKASGNPFRAALNIIETQRRDEAIAKSQEKVA